MRSNKIKEVIFENLTWEDIRDIDNMISHVWLGDKDYKSKDERFYNDVLNELYLNNIKTE